MKNHQLTKSMRNRDRAILLLTLTWFFCVPLACSQQLPATSIRTVLDDQVTAWNQGDVEGFMQGYWQSDELVFDSANQRTKGWQATLDGYQKRYPDRAAMGTLTFSDLVVDVTDATNATVTGRFHLERDTLPAASGHFILTLRRFDHGWRIVRDRTWSDAPVKRGSIPLPVGRVSPAFGTKEIYCACYRLQHQTIRTRSFRQTQRFPSTRTQLR